MSIPEHSRKVGTKWDLVIKQLRENHRNSLRVGSHCEVLVLNSIQNKKDVKSLLISYLNDLTPVLKKSSKLSEEIRIEGNKIYKLPDANLFESVFLYSLCLKCCENPLDFAFCHGNRAAALMKIGFYDVAKDDCEQALKFQHPDQFKIYERLCQMSNASVHEMRKNLAGLEKSVKKETKQAKEVIQQYRTRLKQMEKEKFVDEEISASIDDLKLKDDENGEIKIKQMNSDTAGRYVVTKKSISKDEKILTETPFAFIPVHNYGIKKYFNSDCENCGLVNIWPFLCHDCRMASYCSTKCCEEHKKIHQYECEGYKLNLWFEIGIAHLSMRCLLVGFPSLIQKLKTFDQKELRNKPAKIFQKIVNCCEKNYKDYFDEEVNDEFRNYARIIGLVPNLFNGETFPMKNLPYAYTAQMLTIYLRERTKFFQDHIPKDLNLLEKTSDWDLLVGALILRHMGQLVSNGHAIIDFRQNIFSTEQLKLMLLKNQANGGGLHLLLKSQRVFTGIFPRISMLNHSCSPNIRHQFNGKSLTIFAAENFEEDQEVFNCYGPNYKLMSYQERQDSLRLQYNFICNCTKCEDKSDEYRFNNSVLCRYCNQRLFYPDKSVIDDDCEEISSLDDENDRERYCLKCLDCNKLHENEAMKSFFRMLAYQSDDNPVTMNQVYENYLAAVKSYGTLDEVRFHMTEMMLHTLITNRDAIRFFNANIPLELAIELMTVKEELFGQFSIEFVEAGLYFLDVISILTDKNIFGFGEKVDLEHMGKLKKSIEICSTDIQEIIRDYMTRYCYSCCYTDD